MGKKIVVIPIEFKKILLPDKIPNKFIQIWLSKYYFVNLLHDAWQMLCFVNVTWPIMHYMPN